LLNHLAHGKQRSHPLEMINGDPLNIALRKMHIDTVRSHVHSLSATAAVHCKSNDAHRANRLLQCSVACVNVKTRAAASPSCPACILPSQQPHAPCHTPLMHNDAMNARPVHACMQAASPCMAGAQTTHTHAHLAVYNPGESTLQPYSALQRQAVSSHGTWACHNERKGGEPHS